MSNVVERTSYLGTEPTIDVAIGNGVTDRLLLVWSSAGGDGGYPGTIEINGQTATLVAVASQAGATEAPMVVASVRSPGPGSWPLTVTAAGGGFIDSGASVWEVWELTNAGVPDNEVVVHRGTGSPPFTMTSTANALIGETFAVFGNSADVYTDNTATITDDASLVDWTVRHGTDHVFGSGYKTATEDAEDVTLTFDGTGTSGGSTDRSSMVIVRLTLPGSMLAVDSVDNDTVQAGSNVTITLTNKGSATGTTVVDSAGNALTVVSEDATSVTVTMSRPELRTTPTSDYNVPETLTVTNNGESDTVDVTVTPPTNVWYHVITGGPNWAVDHPDSIFADDQGVSNGDALIAEVFSGSMESIDSAGNPYVVTDGTVIRYSVRVASEGLWYGPVDQPVELGAGPGLISAINVDNVLRVGMTNVAYLSTPTTLSDGEYWIGVVTVSGTEYPVNILAVEPSKILFIPSDTTPKAAVSSFALKIMQVG